MYIWCIQALNSDSAVFIICLPLWLQPYCGICVLIDDGGLSCCVVKAELLCVPGCCDVSLCGSLHVTAPHSHDYSADGSAVFGKHWSGEISSIILVPVESLQFKLIENHFGLSTQWTGLNIGQLCCDRFLQCNILSIPSQCRVTSWCLDINITLGRSLFSLL